MVYKPFHTKRSIMPRGKVYPDEKVVALSVRLPDTMYAQVQQLSTSNRRSLNQEFVWLIQMALEILDQEQKKKTK
jgi:hypothetical protein